MIISVEEVIFVKKLRGKCSMVHQPFQFTTTELAAFPHRHLLLAYIMVLDAYLTIPPLPLSNPMMFCLHLKILLMEKIFLLIVP